MVVTQPPRSSACWATCVGEQRGELVWRRQLGLVCQGEPVAVPMAGGPLLVTSDQGGALFALDPKRLAAGKGQRWVISSSMTALGGAMDDSPSWPPVVLRHEDGKTLYVVANPGGGDTMVIRKVTPGMGRALESQEKTIKLPGPLAGPPTLVGDTVVAALADRDTMIVQASIDTGVATQGPTWRLERAAADAAGYVLGVGGDRVLVSDGGNGLTVWKWAAGAGGAMPPAGPGTPLPTFTLPGRVVTPPVRLPGAAVRFAAADPQGLTLIEVGADGTMTQKRRWAVPGITAGPYAVTTSDDGVRLAAVVGRSRLVWIDPEQPAPLWTHEAGDGLIGVPLAHGGLVVIADRGGRYVGLSEADGKPAGAGYVLRGSVAPACGPVEFGGGRLLCPLTDGTLMLLDAAKLK